MTWCILCILIPLLVGLLCAYLGYLLGRRKGRDEVNNWKEKVTGLEADLEACNKNKATLKSQHTTDLNIWRDKATKLENDNKLSLQSQIDNLNTWKNKTAKLEKDLEESNKTNLSLKAQSGDLDVWKNKITKLEEALNLSNKAKMNLTADLSACKQSRSRLESDLTSTNNKLTASLAAASVVTFNGDAAKAIFGKKIKQDDLKLVEGIGPKIEGLFHNFDIKTWKALSEASLEKCQEVLNSGGDRYKIHNPGTWPKQAKLAYEGKWAELLKWQDELDGGKE